MMEMIPVSSSFVESVGYDPETSTMNVQLEAGLYEVSGVDPKAYQAFMESGSKGRAFNQMKQGYTVQRIG